jgi:hypothetical protein
LPGDILAEIETDKATMEFESFNAGTLLYVGIEEGNTAPVDSLLAIIGPQELMLLELQIIKQAEQRQLSLLQKLKKKLKRQPRLANCSRNCS